MTFDIKVGDVITMPVEVKRTFWEWLTRKPRRTEQRQFKVTQTYREENGVIDEAGTISKTAWEKLTHEEH